ncbi:unnamed protein product [Acanthoscelides obtectus]|uniref:Uncharacterized protein n=1 Tax=Acanthoscelides obtectus TaxID=200917 RepID=A0A9P0QGE2_ACAOB|nr:unnamed protein product [Acanthoscelides obtectus]CAK1654919.1 hypothetical protein AOBTE_LOCUS18921 [Acanthoscelides obtectus]
MISTCPSHQAELKATRKKTRKGEDTFKPQTVIDYNNAKKGVDISDQMSSYYTCIRIKYQVFREKVARGLLEEEDIEENIEPEDIAANVPEQRDLELVAESLIIRCKNMMAR